jgi:glutathione S-transferase
VRAKAEYLAINPNGRLPAIDDTAASSCGIARHHALSRQEAGRLYPATLEGEG